MSKTKEGGGLLASIGLNKDDVKDGQSLDNSDDPYDSQNAADPHKKSDLFDTSKDRGRHGRDDLDAQGISDNEEDFDLGFASNSKKDSNDLKQEGFSNDGEAFEAELAAAGISDDEGPMTDE